MSARRKLNQGFVQGSMLIAGVIGAGCGSWTVFWIATLILVGLSVHSGDVRLTERPHRPRRANRRFRPDRFPDDRPPPDRRP